MRMTDSSWSFEQWERKMIVQVFLTFVGIVAVYLGLPVGLAYIGNHLPGKTGNIAKADKQPLKKARS